MERRLLLIKRLGATFGALAFIFWMGTGVTSCAEVLAKQRADWLGECEADGNKRYQCLERWERMQRGGK